MDLKLHPNSFSRFPTWIPHSRFEFESGVEHLNDESESGNESGDNFTFFNFITSNVFAVSFPSCRAIDQPHLH